MTALNSGRVDLPCK